MTNTDGTTEFGSTGQASGDPKTAAKEMIGAAGQTVRQEAAQFATTAKEKASGAVERQKETATQTLGTFANAIRKAGDELSQSDQSPAARVVRQAADGLEGLSRSISEKRPEELLEAVRDFGRRNPAAFVAGSVLVGLALGRFIRASGQNESQEVGFAGQGFGEDYSRTGLGGTTGGQAWPTAEPATFSEGTSDLDAALRDDLDGELQAGADDLETGVAAGDFDDVDGADDDLTDGTDTRDRGRFGSGI